MLFSSPKSGPRDLTGATEGYGGATASDPDLTGGDQARKKAEQTRWWRLGFHHFPSLCSDVAFDMQRFDSFSGVFEKVLLGNLYHCIYNIYAKWWRFVVCSHIPNKSLRLKSNSRRVCVAL